jgi:hypothetical protein
VKRREFITQLGGAAAAWPLAAHAQQGERVRRIGVLMNVTADDPEGQARFHQGLQEWGWTLGQNARIEIRWGAFDTSSSRRYAAELVALSPDSPFFFFTKAPFPRTTYAYSNSTGLLPLPACIHRGLHEIFFFSLILAGRLPAAAAEGPTTDVLNIAQTV